jgi:peptide/nickel transport system permease protein
MAQAVPTETGEGGQKGGGPGNSAFARIGKYTLMRGVALLVTVVIGVYLTILIANMGGHVDNIRIAQIREGIADFILGDPDLQTLPSEEIRRITDEMVAIEVDRIGLDQPFMVRSVNYLADALTLSLGRAEQLTSNSGSKQVRLILLERIPPTLLLLVTAQMLLFFGSIFVALFLSRRYGSFLDRLVVALAPTSAAPSWFFGIFLILIFSSALGVLPFGGLVDAPPPEGVWDYALSVLKHLILPVLAILLGAIAVTMYYWRTFFLIYSSEDYVEMAKAKGLSSGEIERRYILRPTLPTIITSFAFGIINVWSGSIILEIVFNWPGLGRLIFEAIGQFDIPIIVGSVVVYAYLLALTVFLLDITYAFVDPRVKVGGKGGAV